MDIVLWKQRKKELKLTNQKISDISGIPKRTVEDIFAGVTKYPRSDTVDAIEKVLGLDKEVISDISVEERNFLEAYRQLTEEEKKEFFSIANFILAKRQ